MGALFLKKSQMNGFRDEVAVVAAECERGDELRVGGLSPFGHPLHFDVPTWVILELHLRKDILGTYSALQGGLVICKSFVL